MTGRLRRTRRAAPDAGTAAAEVAAAIERVFAALEPLAGALADQWRRCQVDGAMGSADLAPLQPVVFDALDAHRAFDGAGVVLAEGTLRDRRRELDWWHPEPGGAHRPLILELEVGAPDCYDYYELDWFRAGLLERRRFASGPLIDLPCGSACVLTCATPVVVGDRFLGVAGADVALGRFEDDLLPPLLDVPAPAVLVNPERRVIVSNDARWTTGEKLKVRPAEGHDGWVTVVPVTPDLGWLLAVRAANDRS